MQRLLWVIALGCVIAPAAAEPSPAEITEKFKPAVPPKAFLLEVGEARAKSGRVPRGYGQLSLTKDQKERIYGIQAAYAARIDELEAEIEQLKKEQTVRIKSVLNETQRLQIERYELEAAKKADTE